MKGPTRFRKKPVEIEAMLFDGSYQAATDIVEWSGTGVVVHRRLDAVPRLEIATLEGTMTALEGDWIIKGVKGEFYPCKPDIFEATYEAVQ